MQLAFEMAEIHQRLHFDSELGIWGFRLCSVIPKLQTNLIG